MGKILICLLIPFTGRTQDNQINCKELREGIFKLHAEDGTQYTIVRTKDKQRENNPKTASITELNIKWTSDCKYLLYNPIAIAKGTEPVDFGIDTLYNEITGMSKGMYNVVSTVKGYDFRIEQLVEKIDEKSLFRDLAELPEFRNFKGQLWGSSLISENHSITYRQHSKDKSRFVLAFEEVFLIDHKSKFRLLDHITFAMKPDQEFATRNCKLNGVTDEEIVAVYETGSNAETRIIQAWRCNRITSKIEEISISAVQF